MCTITYASTGSRDITARYEGDGNFNPSASRPQIAHVAARKRITSTMRWIFYYTPTYTRVIGLMVQGAAHARVLVTCHGSGCWLRKYFAFTTLAGREPRIQISCLLPGATRPGKRC
jgi:hypothetical protein